MRHFGRFVALAGLIAIVGAMPGCANFDPDKFDIFGLNEKKPIPGDRKNLFPEGVPGVTQGVPPELIKGNQQAAAPAGDASAAVIDPASETDKPKPKKPVVKPRFPSNSARSARPPAEQPVQPQGAWPPPGSTPPAPSDGARPAPGTSSQ